MWPWGRLFCIAVLWVVYTSCRVGMFWASALGLCVGLEGGRLFAGAVHGLLVVHVGWSVAALGWESGSGTRLRRQAPLFPAGRLVVPFVGCATARGMVVPPYRLPVRLAALPGSLSFCLLQPGA